MSDREYNPVSESMVEEEKRMKELSKSNHREEKKRASEWRTAGEPEHEGQFKKLLFLVDKSKVRCLSCLSAVVCLVSLQT